MKEIVIKLSDTEYNQFMYGDDGLDYETLENAVMNGTILEPHGRLIDADNLDDVYAAYDCNGILSRIDAPTILEAWGNEE